MGTVAASICNAVNQHDVDALHACTYTSRRRRYTTCILARQLKHDRWFSLADTCVNPCDACALTTCAIL